MVEREELTRQLRRRQRLHNAAGRGAGRAAHDHARGSEQYTGQRRCSSGCCRGGCVEDHGFVVFRRDGRQRLLGVPRELAGGARAHQQLRACTTTASSSSSTTTVDLHDDAALAGLEWALRLLSPSVCSGDRHGGGRRGGGVGGASDDGSGSASLRRGDRVGVRGRLDRHKGANRPASRLLLRRLASNSQPHTRQAHAQLGSQQQQCVLVGLMSGRRRGCWWRSL